ncbi:MAG: AAA family ATPase [Myxococcaceae bacterium]|nr:AAA family ATPase [Myxococcaceae bacterium]
MTIPKTRRWHVGSLWLRIDPHLHAPGTLRNDNFKGAWDDYLTTINQTKPAVSVLGITDYGTLRAFKAVREHWRSGKLPGVELLIANVELRLNIQAHKGSAVNAHLLLPSTDDAVVGTFEAKLASLKFIYGKEEFACTDAELVRLGRAHDKNPNLDEVTALAKGSEQFKVEPSALMKLRGDKWFQENVLVAIPTGEDGLKGLGHDDAFHAAREELSALADIIFSGNPSERDFWLGNHKDFEKRGYARKPCLHGCDAHDLKRLLNADGQRHCFIKARATADGLRQVLVEPDRRVHLGAQAPQGPAAGEVIRRVRLENATWMKTTPLELNSGLVTIIGPRGSGKTALADSIALAGNALDHHSESASFLDRAQELAHGLTVELEWGDGTTTKGVYPESVGAGGEPRVQYLSQKFVESLCTPEGLAEPLLEELERIVFEHLPPEDRMEASTFSELRDLLVAQPRARRDAALQRIREETARIAEETAKKARLPKLKDERTQLARQQAALTQQLNSFVITAGEETKKALDAANGMLDRLRKAVASTEQRSQRLGAALQGTQNLEAEFQARYRALANQFSDVATIQEWQGVAPSDLSEARAFLGRKKQEADALVLALKERGMTPDAKPLALLVAEVERLSKTLGLDAQAAKQRAACETQLRATAGLVEKKDREIADAETAPQRISTATKTRLDAYADCVAAMTEEVTHLEALYEPLRNRLADPSLQKLSFCVHRTVDLAGWVERGEQLLDLRKRLPFPDGKGLADVAEQFFAKPWQAGSAAEVRAAMSAFIERFGAELPKVLATGVSPQQLGEWLFALEHVSVRYSVRYEDVDLHRLSPGTRGVVLLTLYLALDDADNRPLVIDQPEENLDPKSVYGELVGFFRSASQRRQVIMVTHNANLVVNTDADQVVIAASERATAGALPNIVYEAGGLEEEWVRETVCGLLEGGREAFAARARRYSRAP